MRFKRVLYGICFLLLMCGILGCVIYIALPYVLEVQIKNRLPESVSGYGLDFKLDKITPQRLQFTQISVNGDPLIDRLSIDYRLQSLKRLQVQKVVCSGLNVAIQYDENNQVFVNGIKIATEGGREANSKNPPEWLRFLPERLAIENSHMDIHARQQNIRVPFNALVLIDPKKRKIEAASRLFPFGESVEAQVSYDLDKGFNEVVISAKKFNLNTFNSFLPEDSAIRGMPDCINGLKIISSGPMKSWAFQLDAVSMNHAHVKGAKNLSGMVNFSEDNINIGAEAELAFTPIGTIPLKIVADLKKNDPLSFALRLKSKHVNQVELSGLPIQGKVSNLLVRLEADSDGGNVSGNIAILGDNASGRMNKMNAAVSGFSLISNFKVSLKPGGIGGTLDPELKIRHFRGGVGKDVARFPLVEAKARLTVSDKGVTKGSINLSGSGGSAVLESRKLSLNDISFNMPMAYPVKKGMKAGNYRAGVIKYDNKHTFSLKGTCRQAANRKFFITGDMEMKRLESFKPEFDMTFDFSEQVAADLRFTFQPFAVTESEIKKVFPGQGYNAVYRFELSGQGTVKLGNSRMTSAMDLKIKDGTLSAPDLKLNAAGINSVIRFNDLLVPETFPGQNLTVDRIDIDKVAINDAKLRFSIEDAKYFLAENLKFKWCKGIVSTEAVRFPQPDNVYSLILYCDRLQLTELLQQMGVFSAEGDGTLSGRLPVFYRDGEISFDNGFLFSTPGSGGHVKIANTDKLTAGIPMDSPQFAQLDLAREALKDFEYKWAKLVLDTFEDNMSLKLQLDGKPAKVLPFEYRRELGGFARVDASNPGSRFQGIKLDVNLNLPFNEVMKFGNKLKSIFNQ